MCHPITYVCTPNPCPLYMQMRVVQREKTNDEMFDELNSRAESSRLSEEQKRKEEVVGWEWYKLFFYNCTFILVF